MWQRQFVGYVNGVTGFWPSKEHHGGSFWFILRQISAWGCLLESDICISVFTTTLAAGMLFRACGDRMASWGSPDVERFFLRGSQPPRCCDLGRPCTCDSSHVFLGGRLHPPVQKDSSLVAAFSIRLSLCHRISGPGDSTKLDESEMVNVSPGGRMWPSGVLGW